MKSLANKRRATRRSFLRAVGAGAASLPFYRLLEDSVARAQGLCYRRTVRISIGEDQDWLGSPPPIDAGVERRWLPGKVIERALAVAWLRADRAKQQAIESCDDRARRIVQRQITEMGLLAVFEDPEMTPDFRRQWLEHPELT